MTHALAPFWDACMHWAAHACMHVGIRAYCCVRAALHFLRALPQQSTSQPHGAAQLHARMSCVGLHVVQVRKYVGGDELIEVTPSAVRIRKERLDVSTCHAIARRAAAAAAGRQ